MSFPQKSFWMLGETGCLREGRYDNSSKVEQKRGHEWLTDSAASELFSKKKQVIEAGTDRSGSEGVMDVSIWNNATTVPPASGLFSNLPFGSDNAGNIHLIDKNVTSDISGNMQMGNHNFIQQYDFNSLVGSPVSHATEDPAGAISFDGIQKGKISQIKDDRNGIPSVLGQFYSSGTLATAYNEITCNPISLRSSYLDVNDNAISISSRYGKEDGSFISMGQAFHNGDRSSTSVDHHSKGEDNISFMGQPLDKRDANFMTMTPSYGRGDNNSYDKDQNFISVASIHDKANINFITMGPSHAIGDKNIMSIGSTYDKAHFNVTSVGSIHDKGCSGVLSIDQNYCRNDINTVSFDGFPVSQNKNPSAGITGGYDSILNNQTLNNASGAATHVDIIQSDAPPVVDDGQTVPPINSSAKTKLPKGAKKATSNNFPANVKSLLSTGMLDGVLVKYVSWSREKNLKATIKGTGYLCGCGECKFSQVVNAYEFERHANCKTKHPNNHIYFENGKTIYAVVQELKNTPQEILFEAIQTVTGSPINQKNFQAWKESYQAATRELERIYGKDEDPLSS